MNFCEIRALVESDPNLRDAVEAQKRVFATVSWFGYNEWAAACLRANAMRRLRSSAHAEFERFRAAGDLFLVALETGLSRGDLIRLRAEAVDLEEGSLRVPRRKTGRLATIGLSDAARAVLARRIAESEARGSTLVFLAPARRRKGREVPPAPYGEKTLARLFALAKELAGITRRLRTHDLRHTFGSRLGAAGLSAFEIRDAMGHASIRTTERYVRTNRSALERQRAALESEESPEQGREERERRGPSDSGCSR